MDPVRELAYEKEDHHPGEICNESSALLIQAFASLPLTCISALHFDRLLTGRAPHTLLNNRKGCVCLWLVGCGGSTTDTVGWFTVELHLVHRQSTGSSAAKPPHCRCFSESFAVQEHANYR